MFNPLTEDLSKLKDAEIENKIQELSRKYFQTANYNVQHQLTVFLDMYKAELATRRARMWQEQYQKRDTDLDSLINVS
jgi:tryptophanase